MKLVVTETVSNMVEVEKLETILQITDFDAGLRQMLEAEQSNTTTATDDIVLTDADKVIQIIDPGGASRNVTLPAESVNNHGYLIYNIGDTAVETLIIKDDAGGAVGTVYPGGAGWFTSNGAIWKSAGLGTTDVATKRLFHWRISGKDDLVTTGDGKDCFTVPEDMNGYNLVALEISVNTVSTSGLPTVQIRNATDSVDMLSTKASIDENEKNSYTAATRSVIDTTYDDVATGDEIMVDVDIAGTGTKGLVVHMAFQLP